MAAAKKAVGKWLPEDLITEVLLRLPSRKPLLRFRCVSKGLRNLIDSRLFSNRWEVFHYSVPDDFTIMFTTYHDDGRLFSIEFQSPGNLNSGKETQVLSPCNIDDSFMGCCRGIVCFAVYRSGFRPAKRYVLFNPSNGTIQYCRNLHVPKQRNPNLFACVPITFAMACGFDDDDFKIVRFQSHYDGDDYDDSDVFRRVDVYSMRSDSWRQIMKLDEFGVGDPAIVAHGRNGLWIEGATHWLWQPDYIRRENNEPELYIVAFDLQSESSRRMMLPPQLFVEKNDRIWLNDFGGRLCACVKKSNNDTYAVWVMEEYAVDNSWTQLFNIVIPRPNPNGFIGIIGYFPKRDGARLLCYIDYPASWFWLNTQDGSKDYIQIHKLSRVRDTVTESWICVGRSPLRLPYSDM